MRPDYLAVLPQQARNRLDELALRRDGELDLAHGCVRRSNMIPDGQQSEMRAKLESQRLEHARAHTDLHRLHSSICQWLVQLRFRSDQIVQSVSIASSLQKGQSAKEAINSVRREIAANLAEQAKVRSLPLKHASRQEAIVSHLAQLAQSVRPDVVFDVRGNAKLRFSEDMVVSKHEILGMLALVCPKEVLAMFEVGAETEDPNAISPDERASRLNTLAAALLLLEYKESVLVQNSDGILPRHDTDPRAFLMVRVAEKTPEAQAVA
jgi:hypothetical protein